ncbi:hypothetical protein B0H14DRAFT_2602855 [Mycena olivaceomarginata]|nr:hypothetical protein B0H14DRAFT_2602855 [Mycena olivaceomarginata]
MATGDHDDSNFVDHTSVPAFQNVFQNPNIDEMDPEDAAMNVDVPMQVAAPVLHQMLLPGAAPAASGSAKRSTADRCAVRGIAPVVDVPPTCSEESSHFGGEDLGSTGCSAG